MLVLLTLWLLGQSPAAGAPAGATAAAQPPRPARPQSPRPAPARPAAPARDPFFTASLPIDHLPNKQAGINTNQGTSVFALLADAAPDHVAHFIMRAREGAYDGTVFHRVI